MKSPDTFKADVYQTAQQPAFWLSSAQRLREAAELILQQELAAEIPYFLAYENACEKALGVACSDETGCGEAFIECQPPNYVPAQLLYAYAIENVLKGLILASNPTLIGATSIANKIKSHDLAKLAARAEMQVAPQEKPVLSALSKLSTWAARYPVAATLDKHQVDIAPDELLDYGSQHPIMRGFYDRAAHELSRKVPNDFSTFGIVVAWRPAV